MALDLDPGRGRVTRARLRLGGIYVRVAPRLYAVGVVSTSLAPHPSYPYPCSLSRARELAASSTGVVLVRHPIVPVRIFGPDGRIIHSGSPEAELRYRLLAFKRLLARRNLLLGTVGFVEFERFKVYANPPHR